MQENGHWFISYTNEHSLLNNSVYIMQVNITSLAICVTLDLW